AAVEGVRFLGGREAGVLADGPWPARVHRRVRPAGVGRKTGEAAVDPGCVVGSVGGVELYAFDRLARQVLAAALLRRELLPVGFGGLFSHAGVPSAGSALSPAPATRSA